MKLFSVLFAIIQKMKMFKISVYKDFTFLNGWGSFRNSLIAVKIGPVMLITGVLNVGTRVTNTEIFQIPGGIMPRSYQYIVGYEWGTPVRGYTLRVYQDYLTVDNNYDIPDTVREMYISGIVVLNVEGGG